MFIRFLLAANDVSSGASNKIRGFFAPLRMTRIIVTTRVPSATVLGQVLIRMGASVRSRTVSSDFGQFGRVAVSAMLCNLLKVKRELLAEFGWGIAI